MPSLSSFGIYESNQKGTKGGLGLTSGHAYYQNLFYNIGAHSTVGDPRFINPANNDFRRRKLLRSYEMFGRVLA